MYANQEVAQIATCSADSSIKVWKFNAEGSSLDAIATHQLGDAEDVNKQLLNVVNFSENDQVQTIAVNLQGDLIMMANDQ